MTTETDRYICPACGHGVLLARVLHWETQEAVCLYCHEWAYSYWVQYAEAPWRQRIYLYYRSGLPLIFV